MARYICSDCYKEFESEQKPDYCPGCGAEAGKLQLLTQSQINDEMETTMCNHDDGSSHLIDTFENLHDLS